MACRIVLCGASSVGKTTLAEDWLKTHQEYAYVKEVARGVMRANCITREDVSASLETEDKSILLRLQNLIFQEQNRQELAHENCKYVISDRGPDPLAYVCQLKDEQAADDLSRMPASAACLERYRSTSCLVVVVGPLKVVKDDGFRLM